jgi:hypothetical protein
VRSGGREASSIYLDKRTMGIPIYLYATVSEANIFCLVGRIVEFPNTRRSGIRLINFR